MDFAPSAPAEYNAVLNSKLDAGSAGDLITCRPFDASLALYQTGKLADLTDLDAMANFSDVAKSRLADRRRLGHLLRADGLGDPRLHLQQGRLRRVGVEVPETEAEFFAVLEKIKEDGTYIPMAMGTNDQWEAATMGYQNIGPNYWKGEEGRLALIAGEQKLTDEAWVAPYATLARWADYLGDGFEAQTYPDSQNLFTLGRAAIYPAGSWEISGFNTQADFEMGAFPPPVQNAGDTCYISDHTDIAIGMNAASDHPEAARTFLNWVGSEEFAQLYANALPGFFSLSNFDVEMEDPLAQEFVSWRERLRVHHPLDLPDPVARHAEPRERDLERLGERDPRHPRRLRTRPRPARGPCELVRAAAVT